MKSFAVRLLVFFLLLVGTQSIVSALNPPEVPKEILQLDDLVATQADILYFGDSTVGYSDDEPSTAEILQEMRPEYAVGEIVHPAYNLDLYLYYVKYLVRSDHLPDVVIIPINMRSFSPEWDLRPGYQFEREKAVLTYGPYLSRLLLRPLEVFGGLAPDISLDAFLDTTVFSGQDPVGKVADYENLLGDIPFEEQQGELEFAYRAAIPSEDQVQALQATLTYYYMYGLDPDHRKITSMLSVADVLEEHGIYPVFYITPINYQQGNQVLGDNFQERFSENTELVKSLLLARDIQVLDLAYELEAFAFVDMEHLREVGKTYIAGQLARVVQAELHPSLDDTNPTATPTFALPETSPVWTVAPSLPAPTQAPMNGSSTPGTPEPSSDSGQAGAMLSTTPTRPPPDGIGTTVSPTRIATPSGSTATPTLLPPASPSDVAASGVVSNVQHLAHLQPAGNYAVEMYGLSYTSLDEDDRPVAIQAHLFVPSVTDNTAFPVLVYGPGTTGVGDLCAPLYEQVRGRDWGNYLGYMLENAAQGYVVILPNGHGFDDPDRTNPYLIAKMEARALLDAARAVYRFFDHPLSGDLLARPKQAVFIGGYSSGGHAAFAAKDHAASYAPELPIVGIIGHGPTTNVETLMRENPLFSPYLVFAYREFYGTRIVDPAEILASDWLPSLESAVTLKCVDELPFYYSYSTRVMYQPEFLEAMNNHELAERFPTFKVALDANYTGVSADTSVPVLILQGTGDTVVTAPSQELFMDHLCVLGNSVTYIEYLAVPHYDIRRVSFRDTLAWMQHVVDGGAPVSDCAQ